MTTILLLKFKRLLRNPVAALVLVGVLGAGACWVLYFMLPTTPARFVLWAVALAMLVGAHNRRRDVDFCRLVLPHPRALFVAEYLIFFAPMIALSVATATWDNAAFYTLCPVCVGLSPQMKVATRLRKPLFFLRTGAIELTSFARGWGVVLVVVSVAATALCYLPFVSVAILLVFAFLMAGAYIENEPLEMVLLPEVSARRFLARKVWAGAAFFVRLNAPALVLYAAFNPRTAGLSLAVPAVALAGIALMVFVKYASYDPAEMESSAQKVAALGMAGVVISPLLPVTLALACLYYRPARETLNKYLHVYD